MRSQSVRLWFLLGDHHLMAASYFLCAWLDTISSLVPASLMLLANSNSQRLGNEVVADFLGKFGKVVSGAGEIATGIAATDTQLRGGVAHCHHHWVVPIVASAGMNDISIFFGSLYSTDLWNAAVCVTSIG